MLEVVSVLSSMATPRSGEERNGEGKKSVWRIGLVSDTHGLFDEKLTSIFAECDEIWHAGKLSGTVPCLTVGSEPAGHRLVQLPWRSEMC